MRLTKLDLQGFKSFVDPTVIDFDLPIIGIVGPNGCGKSNVVDAIRWVMGEQSAKHLRGKAMEDVIFSGSANRAPTGMSAVSLTFSTADGMVPPQYSEYSEITVTRKLFRSGESEYLINKVPCRLRDILDLFLGTGAGTKAYSVIEQGQVDFAINAKPEDRRRLIEEAAGISKFKARRDAALRRMESTQQNLLRLGDILAEIRRQVRSMERQVKKAERYRVLSDELRQLDLHLSSRRFLEMNREQSELGDLLKQWQEKEADAQATLGTSENELESHRLELTEKEQSLSSLQEKIFEVVNKLQLAQTQQEYKVQEIANLEEQCQRWEVEAREAKDRLALINDEISSKQQDAGSIEDMTREAQNRLQTAQTAWDAAQSERQSRLNELETCRGRLAELGTSLAAVTSQIETVQQQRPHLDARLQKLNAEDSELTQKQTEAAQALESSQRALNEVLNRRSEVEQKRRDLSRALEEGHRNREVRQQELTSLQEELVGKRSRLRSLVELEKNLEGYGEGVRTILKHRKTQPGVQGLVADFVEAAPEFEAALLAASGERLQHVVVEGPEAGREAIALLKREARGRSSFIPQQVRGTNHRGTAPQGDGVIGPLMEFIQVKPELQTIADYLFGDVLMVEDLDRALKLWQQNNHSYRLVTREGDLVEPSGVVSGGRHESDGNNLLAKRREIETLRHEVVRLEHEIGLQEDTVSQLEGSLSGFDLDIKTLEQDWQEIEVSKASLEKDLAHQRDHETRLQAQRTTTQETTADLAEEIQSSERTEARAKDQEATQTQEQNEWQQRLSGLQEKSQAAESALASASERLTEERVRMSSVQEREAAYRKDLDRLSGMQTDLKQRMEDRHDDIGEARQKTDRLQTEIAELKEQIVTWQAESDTLKKQQADQQEIFNRDRTSQQEEEIKLRQLRKELDLAREHTTDLRVTLTRLEGDLEHLQGQISERYSVSLAAVADEWAEKVPEDMADPEARAAELKGKIERLGAVNLGAIPEFEELKERETFLSRQYEDLETSLGNLDKVIHKINLTTKSRFEETFAQVQEKFALVFPRLFKGGRAELRLDDPEDLLNTGVHIMVQPPGKRLAHVSLLSGGEKALSAVSFIFAIFLVKPSPFCILDEVDAPLDDANTGRFLDLISEMTHRTQFILITHNKMTMELADALYGVTMQEPGVSKIVSVKLDRNEDLPQAGAA